MIKKNTYINSVTFWHVNSKTSKYSRFWIFEGKINGSFILETLRSGRHKTWHRHLGDIVWLSEWIWNFVFGRPVIPTSSMAMAATTHGWDWGGVQLCRKISWSRDQRGGGLGAWLDWMARSVVLPMHRAWGDAGWLERSCWEPGNWERPAEISGTSPSFQHMETWNCAILEGLQR